MLFKLRMHWRRKWETRLVLKAAKIMARGAKRASIMQTKDNMALVAIGYRLRTLAESMEDGA